MSKYLFFIFFILQLISVETNAQQIPNKGLSSDERERFIQRATEMRKNENFNAALQELDSILVHNRTDAPILLFKGDLLLQAKRFRAAAETYSQLIPLNYEPTITKINLSYALFMNHRPARALEFARRAWQENFRNSNAVVNYFNAMLWNNKTKEAGAFLLQQNSLLSSAQYLVLKARLYTTAGDYYKGLKFYDSLIKIVPDKYYVQEYADVLFGKKEYHSSANVMQQSRNLFTENEYKLWETKFKANHLQSAGTEMVYFKDIAENIRIENSIWWQQSEGKKYRLRLSAGLSTITSSQNQKTSSQFGQLHIDERWNKAWSGETDLMLQLIHPETGRSFSGFAGKQLIKYQPNDRRMIGLFCNSEILNFTASLFENNVRATNAGYVAHILFTGKTGFYSQGSAGILSDNNQRYQFFGSLYRLLRTEPTAKLGINFSMLHFKDSTIKNYFSPNRYLNAEIFADYSTALPSLSKFYLQTQAAAGMQKIEKNKWESSLRLQTELGMRLQYFETSLKYQTSNVASNTGTGYKFNWFTIKFVWKW